VIPVIVLSSSDSLDVFMKSVPVTGFSSSDSLDVFMKSMSDFCKVPADFGDDAPEESVFWF
jgi:hypothetical protein